MRGRSGPLRLRHRVLEVVRAHGLWSPGDALTVACSGGRDSVVLLDLLVQTQRAHGAELSVVTVDHGQRPGSAADASFVADRAASYGLPCEVRVVACGPSEAELRAARHGVFAERVAAGQRVALAHHRQDQAETLLLQVLRGTGSAGRRGMWWAREGLVRPLLDTPPQQLAAWADARGLTWREDPTNQAPRYLRNRVRQELLPLLENLRPGAMGALARSARHAAVDDQHLAELAAAAAVEHVSAEGVSTVWVAEGPEALVRRVLLARWPDLGAGGIDALRAAARRGRGRVRLGGGGTVVVDPGWCQVD